MFKAKRAFSGFSVDDLGKAKTFYTETLGLAVEEIPPVPMASRLILTDDGVRLDLSDAETEEPATHRGSTIGLSVDSPTGPDTRARRKNGSDTHNRPQSYPQPSSLLRA